MKQKVIIYKMIMTCLNMEFNYINNTIFNKINDDNCLNVINLFFDILNEKQNCTYKKSK